MLILTIESSCDETSAAVVLDGHQLLSSAVATQIPVHALYGGVVPELASRNHIFHIHSVIDQALDAANCSLDDFDGFAATSGPGLIGSLLVGVETAKTFAYAYDTPFVGLNHLEGHLTAVLLDGDHEKPDFPFLGVIVSGGHTDLYVVHQLGSYTLLGRTRDDAAGEAFDKVSKMLGLGYPGGEVIDKLAESGNRNAIDFPRPMLNSADADFSFSGLKTAVRNFVINDPHLQSVSLNDLAASFQEAICDVLTTKANRMASKHGCRDIVYSGGVACNNRLRELAVVSAAKKGCRALFAPKAWCTDNAAMLGPSANYYLSELVAAGDQFAGWEVEADTSVKLGRSKRLTAGHHR